MKRLIWSGLISLLMFNLVTFQVNAQTHSLKPFNLVSMAYQGYFREQGIPGYAALRSAVTTQQVTEDSLVEAAVQAGRVSPDLRTDRSYLFAVRVQLSMMRQHRN